jgi:hypothetical protein
MKEHGEAVPVCGVEFSATQYSRRPSNSAFRSFRPLSKKKSTLTSESLPQALPACLTPIASLSSTLAVIAVASLNAYRGAVNAQLAYSGVVLSRPRLYLRTMLFEWLILAIAIAGVRLRGGSLQAILGPRWRSFLQAGRDAGLGIALLAGSILVTSILNGILLRAGSNQSIKFLLPRTGRELLLWMGVSISAGVCEEAVYRGYLQRQFAAYTHSVPAGILISAVAFGAVHSYQGLARASVIAVSAILFGLVAHWRGSVRPGMFAHSIQDAIAPFIIHLTGR